MTLDDKIVEELNLFDSWAMYTENALAECASKHYCVEDIWACFDETMELFLAWASDDGGNEQ